MASKINCYVITAKSKSVLDTLISDVMGMGLTIEHVYRHVFPGFSVSLTSLYLKTLKNDPRIASIEEAIDVYTFARQENSPFHLDRIDQTQFPLSGSYTYNSDGTGVIGYVLDSGCVYFNPNTVPSDTANFNHIDFGGRVSSVNKLDGGGTPIPNVEFDPIYDVLQILDPENSRLSSPRGFDHNGHGTHVAGLLGSNTYGVTKNIDIRSVKVFDVFGKGILSNVIAGIDAIIGDYIFNTSGERAVCNMSFGTLAPLSPEPFGGLELAIQALVDLGITVCAAAGNSGQDANTVSPARMSSVITVGATSIVVDSLGDIVADTIANFSNFGNNEDQIADEEFGFNLSVGTNIGSALDIFAPGTSIVSTYNSSPTATNTLSGTSMSTPMVAGVVALILQNNPVLTPAEAKAVLIVNSTQNIIQNIPIGTANRMLYTTFVDHEIEWVTPAGSLGSFSEGRSLNPEIILQAIGFSGQAITYSSPFSGLPLGITVNSSTGELIGVTPPVLIDTTYNFTIRASDSEGFVDQSFSLIVLDDILPPNWLTSADLSSINEGELLNIQLTASSNNVPPTPVTYSIVDASGDPTVLPYSWALSASGKLTGVAPLVINSDFPFSFVVRADDGQAFSDRIFSLLIKQSLFTQPPTWITPTFLGTVVRFAPVSIQLVATDPDNSPLVIKYQLEVSTGDGSVLGAPNVLPSGLILNENTGIISGSFNGDMVEGVADFPTTLDSGTTTLDGGITVFEHASATFTFQIFAVDGAHVVGKLFTLEVLSQNQNEPVAWTTASGNLGSLKALSFGSVSVNAFDPDSSPLPVTYRLVSGALPIGMALNPNNGEITGIPANISEASKTSVFGLEATDGASIATRTFATTVTRVNQQPVWVTPAGLLLQPINEGTLFSFQLEATDPNETDQLRYGIVNSNRNSTTFGTDLTTFDADSTIFTDIVSVESTLPPGLILNPTTGVLTGNIQNISEDTIFEFTIRVDDGLTNSPLLFSDRTFSIHIIDGALNVNNPPIWVTSSGALSTGQENESYFFKLEAINSDGPASLKYFINSGSLPSGLTLNLNSGIISGFPSDPDFLPTISSFEIRVTDSILSAFRTFNITILDAGNPDLAPVWITPAGNIGTFNELTPMVFALNAVDPDGGSIVYTDLTLSLPTGLLLSSGGIISGTPQAVGVDTILGFTIEASDQSGSSTSQTFSLTVKDVPNIPPIWITPTSLGSFIEGAFTPISLLAIDPDVGPVTLVYTDTSGSATHLPTVPFGAIIGLPPGLLLNSSGVISGSTSVELDTIYSFEVTVGDGASSVLKQFTIEITDVTSIPADRSSLIVKITGDTRHEFNGWNVNGLISDIDLYEPSNPLFGRKIEPQIFVKSDIHTISPLEITTAFGPHHKTFDVLLGLPTFAVVRDVTGNIIYEVIYLSVVDQQDGSSFNIINDYFTRDNTVLLDEKTVSGNFSHLRTELDALPNTEILPDWMLAEQILGDSESALGYIPAIELAYVKPGKSAALLETMNFFESTTIVNAATESTFDATSVFGSVFSPIVTPGDTLDITNGTDPLVTVTFNAPGTLSQVVQDINNELIAGVNASSRVIEQYVPDVFVSGTVLLITFDQGTITFDGPARTKLGLPVIGKETVWNDGSAFDNSTTTSLKIDKGMGFNFTGRKIVIDRYLFHDNTDIISVTTSYDGTTTFFDGAATTFETLIGVYKWLKFGLDTLRPSWITDKGLIGGFKELDVATPMQLLAESHIGGSLLYSITYGSLPDGLILDSETGLITGTVAAGADEFKQNYFVVRAMDNNEQFAERGFEITIGGPTIFESDLTTFDATLMTLDVV